MKKCFLYLAIVNFIDAFATFSGLELGFITEQNPVMKFFYHVHPLLFIGVKSMFTFALIFLALYSPIRFHSSLRILGMVACVLYTFVMAMHVSWIYQYMV